MGSSAYNGTSSAMDEDASGRPGMNFESEQQQSESVDGFLRSENVWGAARHVVLDELFKGHDSYLFRRDNY